MNIKCPDCKGTGIYQGLMTSEPCQACNGLDAENNEVSLDQTTTVVKGAPKTGMGQINFANKLPGKLDKDPNSVWTKINELKKGSIVYVYDCEWFETEVTLIYTATPRGIPGAQPIDMVRAVYSCGEFSLPKSEICWNITQGRWEHIRAGTPVW